MKKPALDVLARVLGAIAHIDGLPYGCRSIPKISQALSATQCKTQSDCTPNASSIP